MAKKSLSNEETVLPLGYIEPREVLFIQLHENLFIPEVGDFGKSVSTDPKYTKTKHLKMLWNGNYIDWSYDDGVRSMNGFIPAPNIKHGIFK